MFGKITVNKLFKKFGKNVYIRNGVGFGFISDEYLYDNALLEIGVGRVTSGYGDWGCGATHSSTSPIKITIDKDFIIRKTETDSFYNSDESMEVESVAVKIIKKFVTGSKLNIGNDELESNIKEILKVIPCKYNIGWDVFKSPHMVKYFTDPKNENHMIRDSEYKLIHK